MNNKSNNPEEKKIKKKSSSKAIDCNLFCELSRLDKSAKNYMMRKYGDQKKTESAWKAIIKKDRVIY